VRSFGLISLLASSVLAALPAVGAAQVSGNSAARSTREQVEAAIRDAEKIISSPGYSNRLKQTKRQELALLKARLSEGDLQPGDQIFLTVQGEPNLNATFTVTAGRYITLPGIGDVSLRGVLRSEVEDYLTTELRKYIRNPEVHATTSVRLSILGAVGRPGFYQIKSETMIGEVIMQAGGPAGGTDPASTRVERNGKEVLSQEAFADALSQGRTLDQMSLRAGDEILVGGNRAVRDRSGAFTNLIIPVVTGLTAVIYAATRIF
jgi:protein involved in polysaccharide export with SLBB domain